MEAERELPPAFGSVAFLQNRHEILSSRCASRSTQKAKAVDVPDGVTNILFEWRSRTASGRPGRIDVYTPKVCL